MHRSVLRFDTVDAAVNRLTHGLRVENERAVHACMIRIKCDARTVRHKPSMKRARANTTQASPPRDASPRRRWGLQPGVSTRGSREEGQAPAAVRRELIGAEACTRGAQHLAPCILTLRKIRIRLGGGVAGLGPHAPCGLFRIGFRKLGTPAHSALVVPKVTSNSSSLSQSSCGNAAAQRRR